MKIRFISSTNAANAHCKYALQLLQSQGSDLEKSDSLLILGPKVSASTEQNFYKMLQAKQPLLLGNAILRWQDFVTDCARNSYIEAGKVFREFNIASEREYLRVVLDNLEKFNLLSEWQGKWQEPQFFNELHSIVKELRQAGLVTKAEIERAAIVSNREDLPIWSLLIAYVNMLEKQGYRLDWPEKLLAAKEACPENKKIFLWGLQAVGLLEIEFLQNLAKNNQLDIAVPFSEAEYYEWSKSGTHSVESAFIQQLLVGWVGEIEWLGDKSAPKRDLENPLPLLQAHSEQAEVVAAGFFLKQRLIEGSENWHLIIGKDYWKSVLGWEFWHSLSSEIGENLVAETKATEALQKKIGKFLSLPLEKFPLALCAEYSHFLSELFPEKKFKLVPEISAKLGIRHGIQSWQNSKDHFLEFVEELEFFNIHFPTRGSAAVFDIALQAWFKRIQIFQLARQPGNLAAERAFHIVLAAYLRQSSLLASQSIVEISYKDWLAELSELTSRVTVSDLINIHSKIQIHAPEDEFEINDNSILLWIGANSGQDPSPLTSYFLPEEVRRKLWDWNVGYYFHVAKSWVNWWERYRDAAKITLFSYAKYSSSGSELSPSWLQLTQATQLISWPLFVRQDQNIEVENLNREFILNDLEKISPTLLSSYKTCAYKTLVERILKIKEGCGSSDLEVSAADRGTILHRAIEIFYKMNGKQKLLSGVDISADVRSALALAIQEIELKYFSGGEFLLDLFRAQAERDLLEFFTTEREYFTQFSNWDSHQYEQKFSHELAPGLRCEGVVDRIDIDSQNKRFMVVDYKSGSVPSTAEIKALKEFQIPMYLNEGERATGFDPVGGYFLKIPTGERNNGLLRKRFNKTAKSTDMTYFQHNPRVGALVEDDEFQSIRNAADSEVKNIVEKIRSGIFPAAPEKEESCSSCAVRPACRIRASSENNLFESSENNISEFWRSISNRINTAPIVEKKITLNEEQKAIVEAKDQMVFVEASAGSGKTTVMVEKIIFLLQSAKNDGKDILDYAGKILAITFTEKAAWQLRERILSRVRPEFGIDIALRVVRNVGTIHGFCRQIVADFPLESSAPLMARVLDPIDADRFLKTVLDDFFISPPDNLKSEIHLLSEGLSRWQQIHLFSKFLAERSLLEDNLEKWTKAISGDVSRKYATAFFNIAMALAKVMDQRKNEKSFLDFSDLERMAALATSHSNVVKYFEAKFSLVMIDEFQDTNSAQRKIIESIASPDKLFLVGDAKQSIYRFRAADVTVFQTLKATASKRNAVFDLSTNRRSQSHIVDFANLVCEKIFPKAPEAKIFEATYSSAKPFKKAENKVKVWQQNFQKEDRSSTRATKEAQSIGTLIQSMNQNGRDYGDIAILLRSPKRGDEILKELSSRSIPFVLTNGDGFYSQQVVLDGISALRAAYDPSNRLAALAVYFSPFYQGKDLKNWQQEMKPFLEQWHHEFVHASPAIFLRKIYENYSWLQIPRWRWQVEKLISQVEALERQGFSAGELIQTLTERAGWQSENEAVRETFMPELASAGAVQILSIHSSKGLEFPVVILADLDPAKSSEKSGMLLHSDLGMAYAIEGDTESELQLEQWKRDNQERENAESKRLLYVAITRAEQELHCFLKPINPEEKKKPSDKVETFSWSKSLRDLPPSDCWELLSSDDLQQVGQVKGIKADIKLSEYKQKRSSATLNNLTELPEQVSVSELSAYRFCAEFHRLKYVQRWDDLVVDAWPRAGQRKRQSISAQEQAAREMLKRVRLQKKERGIALHRVLERISPYSRLEEDVWAGWLEEAYLSQGAVAGPDLQDLIAADCNLIQTFLHSELGEKLFSADANVFPEVSFRWLRDSLTIIGAIDRMVHQPDGRWMVVDYKTSSREESKDRYFTQVNTYRSALLASLPKGSEHLVDAWLIDLYIGESYPVPYLESDLQEVISGIRVNYQPATGRKSLAERKIAEKQECAICPYGMHCAAGQKVVLEFK